MGQTALQTVAPKRMQHLSEKKTIFPFISQTSIGPDKEATNRSELDVDGVVTLKMTLSVAYQRQQFGRRRFRHVRES